MSAQITIPWAKPDFWGNEERYVLEALRSSWISHGPFVDRLQAQFESHCGIAHAVATSNGTTALHLAYIALGLRPGDEIVVPGFAFMAAANIALHVGAVPVFADVDPDTWCLTAAAVARKLSPRTRAIVPVHTYGNICDMDSINRLAAEKGIPVIEDAAEAFGSTYRGAPAGTMSLLGTFSLHATKTVTTGEGGMVVTADAGLAEKMRLYCSHGVKRLRYWHEVAGHNFRMTNMQAAIGCAQIEKLEQIAAARRRMFATYAAHLGDTPGVTMQRFAPEVDAIPWVVAVRLGPAAFPQGRDAVMARMAAAGIETRPGFYTPTRMTHLYSATEIPVSDQVSDSVIALPSFASLTEEQIARVCRELRSAHR